MSQPLTLLSAGTGGQKLVHDKLMETPLFGPFSSQELEQLAASMALYEAHPHTTLFNEGDRGDYMLILTEGKLLINKKDSTDSEKLMAEIGPGRIVGEMAILDGEPRSASCTVGGKPAQLLLITRDAYLKLSAQHAALTLKLTILLARMLSQRLRMVSGKLVDYL